MKLFRKVMTDERLPDKDGIYLTNIGEITYKKDIDYWLLRLRKSTYWIEEVKLHSDKNIEKIIDELRPVRDDCDIDFWEGYFEGFKKCIEILKSEK